ncbi:M14 metallopeptidase family protein [Sphingobacterium bambusae]|uniref:M14 family metallopeptidase n=1 Tax=Sphingobacterium bambusae TaxID=662858 RepID=A0ABW6BE19_9SPHI|nr:M14 family metallopeptidase [Sphingobacterium bambusae]WPL47093.1 M14 family metallopeptidase [Sphingobacterium bambusae]
MKLTALFLTFFLTQLGFAQLKTPEQFLGYPVGTKVTPHWKIIDYYKHVQENAPSKMKMQSYGQSNEGRPLYVAFISSEKNISNLENIRSNNLRLAKVLSDQNASEQQPAIVWMSYNVHGNEISSAEASMLTLYDLINPSNSKASGWLDKTLVILDPCLNPDGTERYINWYNGVVGKNYNPSTFARERNEPWPGGRYNHYYFDLNRDWAWQTQAESQQRVAIYNSWYPHIHVDFHEQGVNSPYYFPPAAEPFHEVITPWQRSFQGVIGKHNAAYFDERGWLYFTKESFDLFYPSYGDTYPTYSGAIGMTYEQAGNTAGGLGVLTNDLDTLTLVDRAKHHHASGINAVEVVADHAVEVVKEFKKFFNDASEGKLSSYATYVIKYKESERSKINALRSLLQKNGIQYYAGSGAVKGYDYASKKEASHTLAAKDLVVPGSQPKAALIRVLFEPEAKLVDSITYDITSWSIPYVYGLDAIASRANISKLTAYPVDSIKNTVDNSYAYAVKWEGFSSAQFAAALLKAKVQLKISEEPFAVNGTDFPRGSLIILNQANSKVAGFKELLVSTANKHQVQLHQVKSGIVDKGKDFGSSKVRSIKAPKVVMLAGEGLRAMNVGEVWHYFDQQLDYPITLVNLTDVGRIKWNEVDALILPNGNYPFLKDKAQGDKLGDWVRAGGKVIALESAVDQVRSLSWSKLEAIKKDSTDKKKTPALPLYADRTRSEMTKSVSGAIYRVTIDKTHPLMYGYENYYSLKQDEKIYPYFKEGEGGWNVGYLKENALMSGFVGSKLSKKMQNGLIFGVESVGRGSVVYLTDNILFRNFWENGKLIMANSIFQVGN